MLAKVSQALLWQYVRARAISRRNDKIVKRQLDAPLEMTFTDRQQSPCLLSRHLVCGVLTPHTRYKSSDEAIRNSSEAQTSDIARLKAVILSTQATITTLSSKNALVTHEVTLLALELVSWYGPSCQSMLNLALSCLRRIYHFRLNCSLFSPARFSQSSLSELYQPESLIMEGVTLVGSFATHSLPSSIFT